ncbi:hypothetical protein SxD43FB_24295, partial [Sphingobium sp. D43FB]
SPSVVWSALRSGLRPSLRSAQTTDPTGHHSCRSTGHRSCRHAPCHHSLHLFAKRRESQHAGIAQQLSDRALSSTLYD